MRRFVTLFVLLLVSVPFGISISGCGKKTAVTFCNASSGDGGVQVGQLNNIVLQPVIYGISLNYGQIGQLSTPTATDCKGTAVTVKAFTYGSQNMSIVDINPATGAICAGTWNRNLNVIPDFTVCTATNPSATNSLTYVTAEANGVTSNPIPVYTHPIVTSVVLGTPSPNCTTDPATNCCPLAAANTITAPAYSGGSCISQGSTGQLVARVFAGSGTSQSNISCQAGHLTFAAQTAGIVSIDENGVATAELPGSTVVTATTSNAGSSAGFFSTCPPTSITLNVPNSSSTNISVDQNFTQPLVATVLDKNNVTLTGLALEYVSTTPTTIPAATGGTVTPAFPGAASITAICQPPTCNSAPFNQIGLFGNGKPVTSNPIGVTTPGTNSTLLYIASMATPAIAATATTPAIPASAGSRYLVPVDFTTTTLGSPVQLPFVPNSMVISDDGTSIYMGSATELMVVSASSDGLTREDVTVPGTVLAVSPDSSTVVISDPVRKLIYLEAAAGGITTQYGAVGTHAQWSPDSQTVYITAGDQLLVYSTFTGWNNITPQTAEPSATTPLDVAVTVPSIGAYLAGAKTNAISYCPTSTITTVGATTTVSNVFNPQADSVATATDRIVATNDGKHIIGAAAATGLLSDVNVALPLPSKSTTGGVTTSHGDCPATGTLQFSTNGNSTPFTTAALTGASTAGITGVFPTSDSTVAVVTYQGSGGVLPSYIPSATSGSAGVLQNVTLSGSATAPVGGVWSTDNLTFFAGTSGDSLVHLIARSGTTLTDSKTIAPALPGFNGGIATPNLLVQKPRKTT